MKYVDEFRDPELGRILAAEILAAVEPGRHRADQLHLDGLLGPIGGGAHGQPLRIVHGEHRHLDSHVTARDAVVRVGAAHSITLALSSSSSCS